MRDLDLVELWTQYNNRCWATSQLVQSQEELTKEMPSILIVGAMFPILKT